MSEKRVKAWAVVDTDGNLVECDGFYEVVSDSENAIKLDGERVVPVTIVWEEK